MVAGGFVLLRALARDAPVERIWQALLDPGGELVAPRSLLPRLLDVQRSYIRLLGS